MANIGSFLGDLQAQRIRRLSASALTPPVLTPPLSPPQSATMSATQPLSPPPDVPQDKEKDKDPYTTFANKTSIDPQLALELRLRWLEALILGQTPNSSSAPLKSRNGKLKETEIETVTLTRLTEDVKKRLDGIVEVNEGLRRFMDSYDQHAQYLTPTFALSGIIDAPQPTTPTTPTSDDPNTNSLASALLPIYENMSPAELEAYLMEMEPDIRAADRDMREIEALVARGVTGAGKLGDYEALMPRLAKLVKEHEEDLKLARELEKRVARLVERHVTHVDALSELFVAWDDTLLEAENRTKIFEREAKERQRLGLES